MFQLQHSMLPDHLQKRKYSIDNPTQVTPPDPGQILPAIPQPIDSANIVITNSIKLPC